MIAMMIAALDQVKSKTFEDVVLHRGSTRVTISVSWMDKVPFSTANILQGSIDVLSGSRGHRKLVSSTKVDTLSFQPNPALLKDASSGEVFVSLWCVADSHGESRVYRFSNSKATFQGTLELIQAAPGVLRERGMGGEVDFKPEKGHHPAPPVSRLVKFDLVSNDFVTGKWEEESFEKPTYQVLEPTSQGHRYRIEMRKRNFQIGNRKLTSKNSQIFCDGVRAYGTDLIAPEKMTAVEQAKLFQTELTQFNVWIDGLPVKIPGNLWRTCFNVHFGKEYTKTQALNDGSLLISASASDDAGGYEVVWKLKPNGTCTRKITLGD